MIKYQDEFEGYLRDKAAGSGDKAAASVKSAIASLNSVCKYLGVTINAKILGTDSDIDDLCARLSKTGKVSEKNIKHYRSAMQQYVNMVNGI